jgi:hypothetical protein
MQADFAGEVTPSVGMDVVLATLGLPAPEDELVRARRYSEKFFDRIVTSARCQFDEPSVERRLKAEG